MSDSNPVTGHPHGGRDNPSDDAGLPGEKPTDEAVGEPSSADRDDEHASRAAEGGPISSDVRKPEPSPGIPDQVDAPSPADSTEGDPPGGSAANQGGRTPDSGASGTSPTGAAGTPPT